MTEQKAELARLFQEIEHKVKSVMRKCFEDKGITMPQGMLIGMLHRHGELMISELSVKLGLSNSTISGIVDRLEKQEIVERVRSQEDKRMVFVKLTPQYANVHKDFIKNAEENFGNLIDKGTPEEVEKIVDGLKILKNILNRSES